MSYQDDERRRQEEQWRRDEESSSRRVEQLDKDAEASRRHDQKNREKYEKIASFDMSQSNSYTNSIADNSVAPPAFKTGVIFALLAVCYRYFEYESEVGPLFLSAAAEFIAGFAFFWPTLITLLSIVLR